MLNGLTGDQRFFLAWAQAWRGLIRDEKLRNQVTTDPHSPNELGEFVATAVLVVRDDPAVAWPLVARVKSMNFRTGAIQAVGSDNGLDGEGAAWVFDGPGTKLPPGSGAYSDLRQSFSDKWIYSEPRTLRFRPVDIGGLTSGYQDIRVLDVELSVNVPGEPGGSP